MGAWKTGLGASWMHFGVLLGPLRSHVASQSLRAAVLQVVFHEDRLSSGVSASRGPASLGP